MTEYFCYNCGHLWEQDKTDFELSGRACPICESTDIEDLEEDDEEDRWNLDEDFSDEDLAF